MNEYLPEKIFGSGPTPWRETVSASHYFRAHCPEESLSQTYVISTNDLEFSI